MAYKFQVGNAILSGSLTQEGNVEIQNDAGAVVGIFDNSGLLSASAGATAATFTADGALTGGSLVVGSADMSETDLEKLDGITNGTGAANKALVLNADSTIASGLVSLTASSGIKAGELEAQGHVIAPALISTTTIQGAAISGSGDLTANRLAIGGPNFAGGVATISDAGVADFAGSVTAGTSFIIGSADLNETDLEKLDGITNGTVAANKALVANAASSIASGLVGLTASAGIKAEVLEATDYFVIGSAEMSEADLEKLDGITNGAGAANKALVLNADAKVASGLAALTASAGIKGESLEATAKVIVGSDLEVGALFKMPTVTSGHILVADGTSFQEVALSGDATIASNGALTLANNSVSQAQLDDDAVGNDEVIDGALKADKLDIDGSTDIGADLADADLFIVDDGAGGTNRKSALSRMKKYVYSAISGDATVNDSGVLTISAGSSDVTLATDGIVLSSGYNYFTGSADADCELPSGSIGTVVTVKAGDTAIGAAVVVNRSGSGSGVDTIDGAQSILLESPYAAVTMVYVRPGEWVIV